MSREDHISKAAIGRDLAQFSRGELNSQLSVRLRLDKIAGAEAERLLAKSRRTPTRRELCRLACQIYDGRRARDRMLDQKLFGEPAWDMLLALYCLPARGEMLSVTGLAHAANAPPSTGHRWQQILMNKGIIERGPAGIDARRQFVRLTGLGREMLEHYLTRLFYCDTPAPPFPEDAGG